MLSDKRIRMLELLDDLITNCIKCDLYDGDRCKPYWTPFSEYVIIGEAPSKNEVENNEPFIGTAGNHLWEIMRSIGLRKEQFLIINSTNCRPINGDRNCKPTKYNMEQCYSWVRKYLKVLCPTKVLLLGNYATLIMANVSSGIMSNNGKIYYHHGFDVNMVFCVHPAVCIYSGESGKKMLIEGLNAFKRCNSKTGED